MPWSIAGFALALGAAAACGAVMAAEPMPLQVPAEATIPAGPEGDAVRLGRALVADTRKRLPRNAGDGLDCTSCHLGAGTIANASPFVGLWGLYPEYDARTGAVGSMEQRVNECFRRSMNGKPLAPGSREMNAILAYMRWLSTGVPVGTEVAGRGMGPIDEALVPDSARGAAVYKAKCGACHGADGGGTKNPAGGYVFPPVWGGASFNVGAGMARTYTAAAFIRQNMPPGQGGTLSEQDAVDVAQFVAHRPRSPYPAAKNDWPHGGRPKDARN